MTDEATGFFGLIRRAGKLEVGDMAVSSAMQNNKIKTILMAADTGGSTRKKMELLSAKKQVPLVITPWDKNAFSHAIGRDNVAVVGITDLGFAITMLRKLSEEYPEHQDYMQVFSELSEDKKLISGRKNRRKSYGNAY